jgi:signal transduction histidine kinase
MGRIAGVIAAVALYLSSAAHADWASDASAGRELDRALRERITAECVSALADQRTPLDAASKTERRVARILAASLLGALLLLVLALYAQHRRNRALVAINRARAEMLARAAHEIRNPLAAMVGLLDLALKRELPKGLTELLQPAHSAGAALIELTQDYLDHSRLTLGAVSVRHSPFALADLLAALLALHRPEAASKGITLELKIDPALPRVQLGDVHKLRQILGNLLGNAVKFSHRGTVELRVEAFGARQRFLVRDDGSARAGGRR